MPERPAFVAGRLLGDLALAGVDQPLGERAEERHLDRSSSSLLPRRFRFGGGTQSTAPNVGEDVLAVPRRLCPSPSRRPRSRASGTGARRRPRSGARSRGPSSSRAPAPRRPCGPSLDRLPGAAGADRILHRSVRHSRLSRRPTAGSRGPPSGASLHHCAARSAPGRGALPRRPGRFLRCPATIALLLGESESAQTSPRTRRRSALIAGGGRAARPPRSGSNRRRGRGPDPRRRAPSSAAWS